MSLLKIFQEQFFKFLQYLLNLVKDDKEEDINQLLNNIAENGEEKRVIGEIFEEIDAEHELMKDFVTSKKETEGWFEEELNSSLKEFYPNASSQEIEDACMIIKNDMENEIASSANALTEEISITPKSFNS